MKKRGFGIIGLGMIAEFHAKAIEEIENARLVAVYTPSKEKAEEFASRHNVRPYWNLDSFLSDPELEICTIASPSGKHLENVKACALKGKDVIVEKPIEITSDRCQEMITICRENGVKLGGIFPSRFFPSSLLIKDAIDRGRFGKITYASASIKWYRDQEYYDSGAWRGTKELDGGGCMMNQGIHAIDLLLWFMGDVKELFAFTSTLSHERINVEDTASVALRFTSGALGTIEATTSSYPGFLKRIEISGTEGSVILEEESILKWQFKDEKEEDAVIREKYKASTSSGGGAGDAKAISYIGHKRVIEDFIASLDENREPLISGESASKAVSLINAAYLSAEKGKPVAL